MPNKYKRKLYASDETATVHQLSDKIAKEMWIDKQCPKEDYGEAFVNEMLSASTSLEPAVLNAITTLQSNQNGLTKQVNDVAEKLQSVLTTSDTTYDRPRSASRDRNKNQNRGNYGDNQRNNNNRQYNQQPYQQREFYPRAQGNGAPRAYNQNTSYQNVYPPQNQYAPRNYYPRPEYTPRRK